MAQFIEIVTEDEKYPYEFGDSTIYYRRFDQAIVSKFQRKWSTPDGYNRRTGEKKTKMNNEDWYKDMLDYIIIDWDNVVYPMGSAKEGQKVPCTRDSKFALPSRIRDEIWELAESEGKQSAEKTDEEKKISGNG